jgi:hypothetical protein
MVWFLLTFGSYLLRGVFSYAYLPIMTFPVVVVISCFFDNLIAKNKHFGISALGFYIFLSILYLFRSDFAYENNKKFQLHYLNNVIEFIKKDAQGTDLEMIYAGNERGFISSGNNFEYLLEIQGVEQKKGAPLKYFIFDEDIRYDFVSTADFPYYKVGVNK